MSSTKCWELIIQSSSLWFQPSNTNVRKVSQVVAFIWMSTKDSECTISVRIQRYLSTKTLRGVHSIVISMCKKPIQKWTRIRLVSGRNVPSLQDFKFSGEDYFLLFKRVFINWPSHRGQRHQYLCWQRCKTPLTTIQQRNGSALST